MSITRKDIHEKAIEEHLERITQEFRRGFEFLQKYPLSITVFGSSMAKPDSGDYKKAYDVVKQVVAETKYTIIDGGGPGVMEAASRATTEAGGTAVGLRINLVSERNQNQYTTDGVNFTYFFARKTMLAFAAEAYLFFPGGYGTLDELFSILTLVQTGKIPRVPVILFDSSFWNPLREFLTNNMLGKEKRLDPKNLKLFEITDKTERVIEIIKQAPVSTWWRKIN